MIYFDNSATTFPKPESVYLAIDYANRNLSFNSGRGLYNKASDVSEMIMDTRKKIASLVDCDFETVVFTSSATESLNMIINGLDITDGDNIYISPFEHNAIIRPLYVLQKKVKFNIFVIPFDKSTWEVDKIKLSNMFALNKPKYIFLSHVSNVTGFILPYESIFELGKQYSSINILDAAQSFGILNPKKDNVDFIVFAGHKSLYASFGVAGFINVNDLKLNIVKSGGNGSDSKNHYMPENTFRRYEAGSLNSAAIYSLNVSLEWLKKYNVEEHERNLVKYCIDRLKKIPGIEIYLPPLEKNLGIISINVKGYSPDDIGTILSDEYDICVRTGFHCSPFAHDFLETNEYGGTVRISFGAFNSIEQIDLLIEALKSL